VSGPLADTLLRAGVGMETLVTLGDLERGIEEALRRLGERAPPRGPTDRSAP
jgi:hypothetical protein